MKTILDDGHTGFLESVVLADQLTLVLIEGKMGRQEFIEFKGQKLGPVNQIDVNTSSRTVKVVFKKTVAWQIVDESYTALDSYEIRDDSKDNPAYIHICERSKYLDYVNQNHGWYADVIGPAKHVRVWAIDRIADAITFELPEVHLINA